MSQIQAHENIEIWSAMKKIRNQMAGIRKQVKAAKLCQRVDVVRLVLPLLARYGVGLTTNLLDRASAHTQGPHDMHKVTEVTIAVRFTHVASGGCVEDMHIGSCLDVGHSDIELACLNAIENAFWERFLS